MAWHANRPLVDLRKPKEPKTPKQPKSKPLSKFDLAAQAANTQTNGKSFDQFPYFLSCSKGWLRLSRITHRSLPISFVGLIILEMVEGADRDFFWDTPWGKKLPVHRQSNLLHVPVSQPTGLLGGGPKPPSKLAALAAARKRQAEEKRQVDQQGQTPTDSPAAAVSLLDRLVSKNDQDAENSWRLPQASTQSRNLGSLTFRRKPPVVEEVTAVEPELVVEDASIPERPIEELKAPPSSFAQALFGSPTKRNQGVAAMVPQDVACAKRKLNFELPYADNQLFKSTDPFAKPSPDDVVLNAQRKGTFK
jgi:elongation factor 1 alpha-like protein